MGAVRKLSWVVVGGLLWGGSGCREEYDSPPTRRVIVTPPPPQRAVVVSTPPRVQLVVGTGIYWAVGLEADVFWYGGRWYWCDGPYWYVADYWGGEWVYVATPPVVFLRIPSSHPRYYVVYRHPSHVHYRGYVRRHYITPPPQRRQFSAHRSPQYHGAGPRAVEPPGPPERRKISPPAGRESAPPPAGPETAPRRSGEAGPTPPAEEPAHPHQRRKKSKAK